VDEIPGREREQHERQANEEQKEEEPDAFHIGHGREPPLVMQHRELSIMIMEMSGLCRYILFFYRCTGLLRKDQGTTILFCRLSGCERLLPTSPGFP